jgi:hypothetical protein
MRNSSPRNVSEMFLRIETSTSPTQVTHLVGMSFGHPPSQRRVAPLSCFGDPPAAEMAAGFGANLRSYSSTAARQRPRSAASRRRSPSSSPERAARSPQRGGASSAADDNAAAHLERGTPPLTSSRKAHELTPLRAVSPGADRRSPPQTLASIAGGATSATAAAWLAATHRATLASSFLSPARGAARSAANPFFWPLAAHRVAGSDGPCPDPNAMSTLAIALHMQMHVDTPFVESHLRQRIEDLEHAELRTIARAFADI